MMALTIALSSCSTGSIVRPPAVTATPLEGTAAPSSTIPPAEPTSTRPAVATPTADLRTTATLTPTELPPAASPTPAAPSISLLFTGNIVPARCIQAKIDEIDDPGYPYEEVRELIEQVDLAIGTLNATLSDITPLTGCRDTFLLVGRSNNADALAQAGFDAMSVATNHIKNCGLTNCADQAFLDTLANLRRVGVIPIGAGQNLAEALQPVVFTVRGVRFAIVSLGEIEPIAFASAEGPGIAVLNEENLRASLQAAREMGDVVIALPHWGPEYSLNPNYNQLNYARIAVEAGADLVVGNHTHTVQALHFIDGIPVFYGLGNFMFDQDWSLETQQGVILRVSFEGSEFTGFDLVPVHTDGDGRIHVADQEEANEILARIEAASLRLP